MYTHHHHNQQGNLIFRTGTDKKGYSCEVYEHIPSPQEIHYAKHLKTEPLEFITELMPTNSYCEQILASEKLTNLVSLMNKISARLTSEENDGQGEPKQMQLF